MVKGKSRTSSDLANAPLYGGHYLQLISSPPLMKCLFALCGSLILPKPAIPCNTQTDGLLSPGGNAVSEVRSVRLCASGSEALVAVWVDYAGEQPRLNIASSPDGQVWSEAQTLEAFAADDWIHSSLDFSPAIAWNGRNLILIVWTGRSIDETRPHLKFTFSRDAGGSWADPNDVPVDIPPSVERDEAPFVLGLTSGRFMVAWQRTGEFGQDIHYGTRIACTRADLDEGSWSEPSYFESSQSWPVETTPCLAELVDTSVLAAFNAGHYSDSGYVLRLTRSVDGGSTWGSAPAPGANILGTSPSLAVDVCGRIGLAWEAEYDVAGPKACVYASTSDDNARSWTMPQIVSGCDAGSADCVERKPQICALKTGGLVMTWELVRENPENPNSVSDFVAELSFLKNDSGWSAPCSVESAYGLSFPRLTSGLDLTVLYAIGADKHPAGNAMFYPVLLALIDDENLSRQVNQSVCGDLGVFFCAITLGCSIVRVFRLRHG